MPKRRRWILLPLAALAAILVAVLVFFDWNWLKSPLEGVVSAALEREFEVADVNVELAAQPVVTLQQMRIANADWGSRPDMLTIQQVRFTIEPWPLLRGDIRLPLLQIEAPDLLLETNEDGLANWKLGEQDQPEAPPAIPTVDDLQIVDAAIRYHEPGRAQDLVAALQTVAGAMTSSGVRLSADGTLNEEPLSLGLASAPLDQLEAEAQRFPFELNARLGSTRVAATGSAERLLEVQGLSVEIDVQSDEPGTLLALAGREPRDLDALQLSLALTRHDQIWALRKIEARLGGSDLSGDASFSNQGKVPALAANLQSHEVGLAKVLDLIAVLTGDAGRAPQQPTLETTVADAQEALEAKAEDGSPAPDAKLDPSADMLPAMKAEVSYHIERLTGRDLLLRDLDLYARLEDGLPRLELSGGGQYQDTPVALDVQLGRIEPTPAGAGAYPVRARIEAAGTAIHLDGAIGKPETLDALDLQVQVESERIGELLALADIHLPQIPPFLITGQLSKDGQVWRIADLYAQFNESQFAGEVTADLSEQRPFISADLQSKRLLLSELISAGEQPAVIEVADAPGPEERETQQAALISLEGVNFDALPDVDADVTFEGEFVEAQDFRFDQLTFDLKLRDQIAVLDASGEGKFRDGPLTLEAHLGTEQTLEDPGAPYPIDVQIASEETRMSIQGTAAQAGRSEGLQVDVALRGPDLDRVGEILQLPLPTTPPFDLQSHLARDQNRWVLTDLHGTVGDSDLQGRVTIVLGGERPTVEAELTSNALDFDDLGLLVGAPADPDETVSDEQGRAAAEEAAKENLLPDEPFDVPELRAMDARVSLQAKQVQARKLPLEGMALDLILEDGQLTLEPLRFAIADGTFESVIRLDGRSDVMAGDLEFDVSNIRLNQLLARFDIEIAEIEMEEEGVGAFSAHAKLAVRGNSIRQLAGSADGQAVSLMRGGQLNALIVEAVGLDIGEAVALLLTGDEEAQSEMVPIRCFVGDFEVEDGIMRAEALVLDTRDSTITGKGQIDLGAETLSLEFLAHPKDPSVLTASTPVRIEGTFKEPEINVISEELQEKSLAALALGVLLPVVGAVLPFIEQGETEDKDCGRLIEAALASVERASPAPQSD